MMFAPDRKEKPNRKRQGYAPHLLLLAAFAAAGCNQKTAADPPAGGTAPAMSVQVQIAQAVRIPETTEYLSILKSRHSAAINPQVEGQITKIFVKSGDRVTAGTPLLQIKSRSSAQKSCTRQGSSASKNSIARKALTTRRKRR
jgi:multidrug efflux pump subunit AcrA (membrane-fusion protein)